MKDQFLKEFLDKKVAHYNQPLFIEGDPISVPHLFTKQQDIEIAGFFSAILAWGNRTTIIKNSRLLMQWMDHAPYDFILHHKEKDRIPFLQFRHRTFNATDLLFFLEFFQEYYSHFYSLETAFTAHVKKTDTTTERALSGFYNMCFAGDHPERTHKHIASPAKHSACKRLNMFLRWMVRDDDHGVDFGLWKTISPAQLVCPMDVHVARVAKKLNLVDTDMVNWKTATSLTDYLRTFDPADPVKYDFALFGLGVVEKYA